MRTLPAPSRVLPLLVLAFAGACGAARQAPAPRPAPAARTATSVGAPSSTPPADELYAAEDALRDALSGPLEFVGKGEWPGLNRMHACAFRNARVFVVTAYCTPQDTPAVRIDVYSPSRGRARVYAESPGAVFAHMRQDYFTFTAESEPSAAAGGRVPPIQLSMSFDALRAYEHARYAAYLPACYGGVERGRRVGGCLGTLAPRAGEWALRHRAFFDQASDDWYRVIRQVRKLAIAYGKEPSS